jgi:hypothetical protein
MNSITCLEDENAATSVHWSVRRLPRQNLPRRERPAYVLAVIVNGIPRAVSMTTFTKFPGRWE